MTHENNFLNTIYDNNTMEALKSNLKEWKNASSHVFWGEIAPCDHVVQIYDNDDVFLDLLAGFVHGGVTSQESVVVIATREHLEGLKERMTAMGLNHDDLVLEKKLFPLDAEKTLSRFMVNDWPDENLFMSVVTDVIENAKSGGRQVRAFGEMVAVLWSQGHIGATVRLEHLWNKFCETEAFCLFCAYPKSGFTQDAEASLMHICSAHTKMITGVKDLDHNVFYKEISFRSSASVA
jgi:hypothetical protein